MSEKASPTTIGAFVLGAIALIAPTGFLCDERPTTNSAKR